MDDDAELKSPVTDVEHAFATVAETDVHEHEALGHEPAPQDPVEEVQVHPMPSNDAAHLAEGGSAGSPKVAKVVQKPPATKTAGTRTIRSPISDKRGTAKPAPTSRASTSAPLKPTPLSKSTSALSKSTSGAPEKKAPLPKSPTASTTMSSRPPPPSRRSSLAPARGPPAATVPPPPKSRAGTLFSSLTGVKSPNEPTTRSSVVSPAPSTGSTGRSMAAPAATPRALGRPLIQSPPRGLRPSGSISSIREVDENKALADLQSKLKEANDSILAKMETITGLEERLLGLQTSLDASSTNAKAQNTLLEKLRQEKDASDAKLASATASLRRLENEHTRDLDSIRALETQHDVMTKEIIALQERVAALTSDIAIAEKNYESLRTTSEEFSSQTAAAAEADRESFLRVKADLDSLNAEMNELRAAHDTAVQDAAARLSESEWHAAEGASLATQIEVLKDEREGNANRISELEVEVLELKESHEHAEDKHNQVSDHLKKVEGELAAVREQATNDVRAKTEECSQKIVELEQRHKEIVQGLEGALTEARMELESLKTVLASAQVTNEDMRKQAEIAAEDHERQLEEAEQSYLSKHIEFSEEIRRLTTELEGQEANYNEKVIALKAEHDILLQKGFERAKGEAAEAHGQELQALRGEYGSSIEQLRTAHESFVNDLQSEHQAALESQVTPLENRLNSQAVDLRATQDDLTKAKAALDAAHAEIETLKAQVEASRAAAIASSASADQMAEIEHLNKRLTSMQDENTMLNDVLAATKESLTEMAGNHSRELEEAARSRADEATRLRTKHEKEISALAAQKSELILSLGDLESEITVLKARLVTAESATSPRNNGAVPLPAGVTREELQKVHEAHNAKMLDQQDEHVRAVRRLQEEIDTLQNRLEGVQTDLARKNMEIQYLEQEQEESQDSITRLKERLSQYEPNQELAS